MVEATSSVTVSPSDFLMKSKLPSINGFSMVLCSIGGRAEIKKFLKCLCKGAGSFYDSHVKDGGLFLERVRDTLHFEVKDDKVGHYFLE